MLFVGYLFYEMKKNLSYFRVCYNIIKSTPVKTNSRNPPSISEKMRIKKLRDTVYYSDISDLCKF